MEHHSAAETGFDINADRLGSLAQLLRKAAFFVVGSCFYKQGALNGGIFCPQTRRFSAAILTDCKGKQRRMRAKRPFRRRAMLVKTTSKGGCLMKTDIEIAQEAKMKPITEIAAQLGLSDEHVIPYGRYKAKIDHRLIHDAKKQGKLILVTAISPTPAGEGKTTTSVGLADAMNALGKKTMLCLREPSLGPVFGVKGGAAGGGYAQVVPMEDLNLHFTGDFHAIGIANNLMAALIDNHIHQGNALNIDTRKVVWKRVVDMNDRQLRHIVCGMGAGLCVWPSRSQYPCLWRWFLRTPRAGRIW